MYLLPSISVQRQHHITDNDAPYSLAVMEAIMEHGLELFKIHPKGLFFIFKLNSSFFNLFIGPIQIVGFLSSRFLM